MLISTLKRLFLFAVVAIGSLTIVPSASAAQTVSTVRPAAVRTAPNVGAPLNPTFTPSGILQPGTSFQIVEAVAGQNVAGINTWLKSTRGNFIWAGNTNYGAQPSLPSVGPSGGGSGVEQWRGVTGQYFGGETDFALRVMKCESGGNPRALGAAGERGLLQIHPVHADKVGGNLDALYDPATNLRVAKTIRDSSGWSAWSCAK